MTLVLDASVALDWCFESERSAYAESVLDHVIANGALVPPIWPAEIANALISAKQRGRVTAAGAAQAVAMLSDLEVEVAEQDWMATVQALLDTGDRLGLTAYDAAYLSLAMQEGFPLATNDLAVRRAAQRVGVPVFGLEPSAVPA